MVNDQEHHVGEN
jgi:hypothetical protein